MRYTPHRFLASLLAQWGRHTSPDGPGAMTLAQLESWAAERNLVLIDEAEFTDMCAAAAADVDRELKVLLGDA